MKASQWAQDISRQYGNMTSEEDLTLGYKKIAEPKCGDVVFYKEKGSFHKVKIAGGQYLDSMYGRVTNWWYWREIDENENESKEVSQGYGNFFINI